MIITPDELFITFNCRIYKNFGLDSNFFLEPNDNCQQLSGNNRHRQKQKKEERLHTLSYKLKRNSNIKSGN